MSDFPARFWSPVDSGRIICELCPRECALSPGQRGFCFVRQNIDQQLVLTTYGRSSGFCVDPIEKKPLNHFYPGSSVLSFGTAGCNLGCKFCQNWDISKSREWDRLTDEASPRTIAKAAQKLGCRSVAFTYNDPVIFAEYAIDIAVECRKLGVKTVAVTAGYINPVAREEFFSYMDAANVDLKAFSEEFYSRVTLSSLQPVLDTLLYLRHDTDVWFEITTLLIPGENDDPQELQAMCAWIVRHLGDSVPLHFTAFHPDYKMLNISATSAATLTTARQIAMEKGLKYVYTGNVHDSVGASTYCAECGVRVIERDWYVLGDYRLNNKNRCDNCQAVLPGQFDSQPGRWGARRQPVRLADFSEKEG
ncbi:MAG: AmmeMemoRadiSam system radical SAM enzyme [Candidatus Omnitrophica bacterium]|nr:AmmeMemoRadiSam system radical SAM enzyme [Candidatus Omnitrophota bacterium]